MSKMPLKILVILDQTFTANGRTDPAWFCTGRQGLEDNIWRRRSEEKA